MTIPSHLLQINTCDSAKVYVRVHLWYFKVIPIGGDVSRFLYFIALFHFQVFSAWIVLYRHLYTMYIVITTPIDDESFSVTLFKLQWYIVWPLQHNSDATMIGCITGSVFVLKNNLGSLHIYTYSFVQYTFIRKEISTFVTRFLLCIPCKTVSIALISSLLLL